MSVLLLQAVIGTLLSVLLLFVDSINTYYWMLTALVAQTFLVMYLLMYASVVHLRRTQPDIPRPFRIPGGRVGLVVIVGIGVAGSVFTFLLGFIPASHLSVEGTALYVLAMVRGHRRRSASRRSCCTAISRTTPTPRSPRRRRQTRSADAPI